MLWSQCFTSLCFCLCFDPLLSVKTQEAGWDQTEETVWVEGSWYPWEVLCRGQPKDHCPSPLLHHVTETLEYRHCGIRLTYNSTVRIIINTHAVIIASEFSNHYFIDMYVMHLYLSIIFQILHSVTLAYSNDTHYWTASLCTRYMQYSSSIASWAKEAVVGCSSHAHVAHTIMHVLNSQTIDWLLLWVQRIKIIACLHGYH